MRISTRVLNWNRKTLLQQCLQSYAATIDEALQLIVIDNASEVAPRTGEMLGSQGRVGSGVDWVNQPRFRILEKQNRRFINCGYRRSLTRLQSALLFKDSSSGGSREVIERFCTELSYPKPIFLGQNLGAEAINLALEEATGDLNHISENDQIYLADWSQHARECFTVFTALGQFSLHGVVPTDEEVWELKPANLCFSKGKIVYEAQGNVGTSSVILGDAFRRGGIHLHNISQGNGEKFKFPDGARLSADIKNLGLLCVWSDRYYIRNLGHEYSEFGRDSDDYRKNYDPRDIFAGTVQKPLELPVSESTRPVRIPGKATTKGVTGERAAVLVLGMHRSGTSALARVLSLLGAALPEGLLGPGYGNMLGHWESKRLMEIDDEILHAMGRTWDDPRQIPAAWFRSRTAYSFHERLREVIQSEFADAPLIIIKEPRICRLAPLYLDVLDALGMRPHVVLTVRHPVEVIRSISDRNELDQATIEFLWLRHVLEAETASRSCRRVWTRYDQLLRSWEATVQSIARGLDITWPNEPEHVRPMIDEFLRPRHRHHQIDKDPNSPLLGHLTTRAWEAVQHALDGNETATQVIFDKINATLEEIDRMSFPGEETAQRRLLAVEAERNDLRDDLAKVSGEFI